MVARTAYVLPREVKWKCRVGPTKPCSLSSKLMCMDCVLLFRKLFCHSSDQFTTLLLVWLGVDSLSLVCSSGTVVFSFVARQTRFSLASRSVRMLNISRTFVEYFTICMRLPCVHTRINWDTNSRWPKQLNYWQKLMQTTSL